MFNQVTQTIFNQMGGWQFANLVGTKAIGSQGDTLLVRFTGKAKSRINLLKVTLSPDDTYAVEFCRASKAGTVTVKEYNGVYCDQLKDLFEETTGLYVSLFARR